MKLSKTALKSTSLWFSVVAAVLAAATQYLPALKGTIDPEHYAILAIVVPSLSAAFRAIKQRSVSGDD